MVHPFAALDARKPGGDARSPPTRGQAGERGGKDISAGCCSELAHAGGVVDADAGLALDQLRKFLHEAQKMRRLEVRVERGLVGPFLEEEKIVVAGLLLVKVVA